MDASPADFQRRAAPPGILRAAGILALLVVATCTSRTLGQYCDLIAPTPPTPLGSPSGCDHCLNNLLPGALEAHPHTRYYIESDLPEKLLSTGVLYATTPILPPDTAGKPILAMRTQIDSANFTTIDDDFDVFLWHTSSPGGGSAPRRIVIYVRNDGMGSVQLAAQQVMITDGAINVMGANLASRVMQEDWDVPIAGLTLPAGQGDVVAYSKRFAAATNSSDQSTNVNCFGRVRVAVDNSDPVNHPTQLSVYVVAIDAAPVTQNKTRAEELLGVSAMNGDPFDLDVPPSGCANRRATGVMETFIWRSEAQAVDVASLVGDGIRFRMAMADLNAQTCPAGRQTADLVRRPGFVRPDSVGNYMKDYRITLRLVNPDPLTPRTVDIGFTQTGASIGLAWRLVVSDTPPVDAEVDAAPVRTGWAGAGQSLLERSFFEADGGPLTIPPCQQRYVGLQFLILGNSSLPFDIRVAPPPGLEHIVDNLDAGFSNIGVWPPSANSGYWGSDSLYHIGDGGVASATWTPDLPAAGRYRVYAWWIVSSNRTTAAPYAIHDLDGPTMVLVNQADAATAARWNLLGEFAFSPGSAGKVVLTSAVPTNRYVSADAVRWEFISAPPVPGDVDFDGDVDLGDLAAWEECVTGPDSGPPPGGCAPLDLDVDGDVDLRDFAEFTMAFDLP